MSETLLRTKLIIPPLRPNLVPRPHLFERLLAGIKGPRTFISAPAGYGKTISLGEWWAGPGAEIQTAWQIHRSWIYTRWPSRFQRATYIRPRIKAYA